PGDGGPGHVVPAQQDRHDPRHVVALLAAGQPTAEQEVVDLARVQLRNLGHRGADHLGGEVVGPHVLERTLEGAADRRARGGDDDCLGHGNSCLSGRSGYSPVTGNLTALRFPRTPPPPALLTARIISKRLFKGSPRARSSAVGRAARGLPGRMVTRVPCGRDGGRRNLNATAPARPPLARAAAGGWPR